MEKTRAGGSGHQAQVTLAASWKSPVTDSNIIGLAYF